MRKEETLKKERVVPSSTTQTKEIPESNISNSAHKSFTTKPKLRRLTWHKQQTVRNRAYALQESFYPTKDVSYQAVRQRMATFLGIYDKASVLAYLGRPKCASKSVLDQTVSYKKSGKVVPKTHYFSRRLAAKRGYIDLLGLGYVYSAKDEWFIHWYHVEQLKFVNPPTPQKESHEGVGSGLTSQKVSKLDFSLSYNTNSTPINESEHCCSELERRERVSKGERNCESESNQQNSIVQHSKKVKVIRKTISPETLAKVQALRKKWMREDGILLDGDSHG